VVVVLGVGPSFPLLSLGERVVDFDAAGEDEREEEAFVEEEVGPELASGLFVELELAVTVFTGTIVLDVVFAGIFVSRTAPLPEASVLDFAFNLSEAPWVEREGWVEDVVVIR